jgi:hypothetical protein
MNSGKIFTIAMVLCSLFVMNASADVPHYINFQGTLTDTSGNPINSTISLMRFTIYADSVGGTALWSENQSNVQVSNGLFRVILGSSTAFPSSLFNGSKRWLAIRMMPDTQDLTPRQPIVMVPYGYRAKEADHSVRADTATHAIRADSANWSPNSLQIPLHLTGDTASAAIIWGTNTTGTGYAIEGENSNTHTYGYLAGNYYGAFGLNLNNLNRGFLGHNDYGIWGTHGSTGNWGDIGDVSHGVYGEHNSGTNGFLGGDWGGAFGSSPTGQYWGYLGFVSAGTYGYSSAGPWGLLGNDSIGVWGSSSISSGGGVYGRYLSGPSGWLGRSSYGVYGIHTNGNYGYLGGSAAGAYGNASSSSGYGGFFYSSGSNGYGIYANSTGSGGIGLYARGGTGGRAATLRGNVVIQGLTSGTTVLELGEGLDYAEGFDVASQDNIEPGTVLVIDPNNPGKLTVSSESYDSRVAGIVAGAKGLGSGVRLGSEQFNHNVALAGRVYCNVVASESNIEPGDLLTTSSIQGYAMKASDYSKAPGTILGKAMEHLEKGQKGQILVLVTLQ